MALPPSPLGATSLPLFFSRQSPTAMYASRTTSNKKMRAKRCWTSSWATAATASGRGVAEDVFVEDDDAVPDCAVVFASVPFSSSVDDDVASDFSVVVLATTF